MNWNFNDIYNSDEFERPQTNPEISNDGEICLWNGEVLVRRFIHCTTCDNIFNLPTYVNLSRLAEGLEKMKTEIGISTCSCGQDTMAFIALDEIILPRSQGDY